jgi:zinc protease
MRRLLPCLAFVLFAAVLPAATPFAHESSDLRADPAVRYGALPNGLRYAIRANAEPKQRASFRLLVEAGALHETEDQRGLAHFLEHMAFNGSEHYAPGTLIEFFQRMGMNFGGDTNASTGFERTLYLLELPDTKPATLAEGLRVFADYAGDLLLKPEEINKERGVILSEKRTSDSVGYRTALATYGFLLQGTLFPQRFPIGETPVIEQAGRDRFADFYNAWYRPELMSVVVVGDIDVAAVEKQIVTAFTPLQPRAPARAAPDLGKLSSAEGTRTFYHYESEAPNTRVEIATITPYSHVADTAANRLKYLPRSLANSIINRRLSILAKKENAPFTHGSASADEAYNFFRQTSVSLTCKAEQWEAALGVADQELRRALEHGFQPAELQEAVANFRNSLEQAAKTAATRHSDGLANEIAQQILDGDVFMTPADELALYGPALDKLTPADCAAALRESWRPAHRLVLVTGNAQLPGDAHAVIAAAYGRTSAVAVTAPEAIGELKWGYTDFGPAGKIAKRDHVADLDITLITFENGVRLNLKKTDFEANRIRVSVRVGTGGLTEPKDQPGLGFFTGQTFTAGGLGQHSADDLRRILAGKTVGAGFSAGGDAFTVGGATNREDLLLELQLIAAHLTDPGYRPEAARQFLKAVDQMYTSFAHTASGPYNLEVPKLLASGDPRFGFPAKEEMLKRNVAEVKAWLTPQLQHGALEIAIVGDFDPDATIAAVAQTLGALPKRDAKPALDDLRRVAFPSTPFNRTFPIDTEIQKADVRVYWPTTDGRDIRLARRLGLLAEVLSDRLRIKIREELGDAYSPGAGSNASDLYPGYGYILAGTTVEPAKTQKIADVIAELAAELAAKGVTEDELTRAKGPILTSLRESARTNGYWIGNVVSRAQEKPEVLDWCRTRYADNEAITAAELSALAKKYFAADRASRVVITPAR